MTANVIGRLAEVAVAQPDIQALYVFGSQANGTARPDSDVDVGILYTSPQPLERTLALQSDFEHAVGCPVDVVDAARAGAFLALDIIRGERFCRDATAVDRFDLYVLRSGDLLPLRAATTALLGLRG